MDVEKISLEKTQAFKGIFIDYINKKKSLKPFYGNYPDLEGFRDQINKRQFSNEKRGILNKVLTSHYADVKIYDPVLQNIEFLKEENTFTITTGHQLNIFTGPLYFIYKIVTVINLASELKKKFPEKNFVPVYWMAGEDHDYDEIKYFNLFGKKYTWETNQSGAVGNFSLDGMDKVLEELPEKIELFEKAYSNNKTLAEATFEIVNELFGKYGLVIVNADNKSLKSLFAPVIKDDLNNHRSNDLAGKAAENLDKLGYTTQVYPRTINLFYLENGTRERIVKDEDFFKAKNTDIRFSHDEMMSLVDSNPEKFSPNVVLRPLYQEVILPNIAYIGGPAEIAYWLQLKSIFQQYKTDFPILVPRNFALVIPKSLTQKIDKLNIKAEELFQEFHEMKVSYIARNADDEISIDSEIEKILQHYECIKSKANRIDKSLEGFIGAEASKTKKGLENIAKRIRKSEERKQETEINQLENIKSKLFPENGLQERHDNFLNFYINNQNFIEDLIGAFDPLDFRFNIISYNE